MIRSNRCKSVTNYVRYSVSHRYLCEQKENKYEKCVQEKEPVLILIQSNGTIDFAVCFVCYLIAEFSIFRFKKRTNVAVM